MGIVWHRQQGWHIKTVKRTLDFRLYEPNLREIFKYAFAAGIFPEAMPELKEAYAALSEAMRQLNLTGPSSSDPLYY